MPAIRAIFSTVMPRAIMPASALAASCWWIVRQGVPLAREVRRCGRQPEFDLGQSVLGIRRRHWGAQVRLFVFEALSADLLRSLSRLRSFRRVDSVYAMALNVSRRADFLQPQRSLLSRTFPINPVYSQLISDSALHTSCYQVTR